MPKLISLSGLSEFKSKLPVFIEGEGFIKNAVNNLINYYKKSETYTQSEINELIAKTKQFIYEVVTELPVASEKTMFKIYLVKVSESGGTEGDCYAEYITIDKGETEEPRYVWEKIGNTRIDLSNYYTKAQADAAIGKAIAPFKTESQIKDIIEEYDYTEKDYVDTELTKKQNIIDENNKVNADLVDDAETIHKFVSIDEKNKLDSVAEGAQVNVLEIVKVDNTALTIVDKAINLETATNDEIDALFA